MDGDICSQYVLLMHFHTIQFSWNWTTPSTARRARDATPCFHTIQFSWNFSGNPRGLRRPWAASTLSSSPETYCFPRFLWAGIWIFHTIQFSWNTHAFYSISSMLYSFFHTIQFSWNSVWSPAVALLHHHPSTLSSSPETHTFQTIQAPSRGELPHYPVLLKQKNGVRLGITGIEGGASTLSSSPETEELMEKQTKQ